jgi:23S rRNA pseudouridine1911/1915/1917 synthase
MRWITRSGDGPTVGDVLVRAGADREAVTDGRVFVGRRRVRTHDEPVQAGDIVEVAAPRSDRAQAAPVVVLARARDLVAVDKPAGTPTIADHEGAAHALVPLVARSLGIDVSRVHATSRLDRDVSGVVILALSRAAATRLHRAREVGDYQRRYVAIATREPEPPRGLWDAPIGRAADPRLRMAGGRDPTAAQTRYATCACTSSGEAMLAVAPVTGRTHQIRVHAAHAGAPLLGDRAYGGPIRMTVVGGRVIEPRRIALHAARVVVRQAHRAPFVAEAPVPTSLQDLWAALGGDPTAWELAPSCDIAW